MPLTTWNGRLQGLGGGGYTGSIGYAALAGALRLGYVAANTDMGTAPSTGGNGTAIIGHPEKWLDFGVRSTHEMTVAAKSVLQAFYGKGPDHSYFVGCSTGGHQGLEEAQVFPHDYDGIVAGAPGHNRTHLHATFVSDWVVSHKAPGSVISPPKLTMLHNAVIAQCQGKDGGLATDRFLNDPRDCGFDVTALQCTHGDGPDCLTSSEIVTAKHMYGGLRNTRTQELIYPGWALGSELGWTLTQGGAQPAFPGILDWALDSGYDALSLNFDSDMATVDATLAPTVNFMNSDISRFAARGGKLLMYHGFADPIVSTQDTINYYKRMMSEQRLTLRELQSFARLFLAPGMGHCSGGDGPNNFDKLSPLVNWVEKGAAPDSLVATKFANNDATMPVEMTRPLCAFPREARFSGSGDANTAANWHCVDSGRDEPPQAIPARVYLSPLIVQAHAAPSRVDLRSTAGLVTVVLHAPHGSDSFSDWVPGNIKAEGASPVIAARSADARSFVVSFKRSDLSGFLRGRVSGEPVDLMLTGTLRHDGAQSLFAASATITPLNHGGERESHDHE